MRLDHAKLVSHVYENPNTRLRLDVKVEEIGQNKPVTWYWIQIEERSRGRFLDHFLDWNQALHLACTIILEYRGDLEKADEFDHLKEWAKALVEKLEGSGRGEEE